MYKYVVYAYEPYENKIDVFRAKSREELVEWFRKNIKRYYDPEDLSVYSLDAPSVDELVEEAFP